MKHLPTYLLLMIFGLSSILEIQGSETPKLEEILDKIISINYEDEEVSEIIIDLCEKYNISAVLPSEGPIKSEFSIRLTDVPLGKALDIMVNQLGAVVLCEHEILVVQYMSGVSAFYEEPWSDFDLFTFVVNLDTFFKNLSVIPQVILNMIFALGVLLKKNCQLVIFKKIIWVLSVLIGGIFVLFVYWIIYYSTMSQNKSLEEIPSTSR